MATHDTAFEMAASSIRFGAGVTREVGMDLSDMGVRRVLVLTDPIVARLPPVAAVLESLEAAGIAATLFDRVRVEPTESSLLDATAFAQSTTCDAFVAVGGGSVLDTAKAVNLYSSYPPDDFLDYVNPPIGGGRPVPGPLKPLMAIPTTAGTGSETTGVAIFDLKRLRAKTGIASRRLKPTLGYLNPENTRTLPPEVAASSGLDVLSHAPRVVHRDSLYRRGRARSVRRCVPPTGIQSDQRRLGAPGAPDGRPVSGSRRRGSVRRRGARADAAGRLLCGRRFRQCRRASAARHVVSRLGSRPRASARPAIRPITRSCRTACR